MQAAGGGAKPYYFTLDGFRGFAAIYIAVMHGMELFHMHTPPSTPVSVDFFLLLSGFVLANASDAKLRGGMTAGAFMATRLERLYPIYFLGLVLGTGVSLLASLSNGGAIMSAGAVGGAAALGLFFIPAPFDADRNIFPLDVPCWFLFYLVILYLLYAYAFRWLRTAVLLGVVVVTGAAFSAMVVVHGNGNMGAWVRDMPAAFLRSLLSFTLGILLFRHPLKVPRVPAPLVLAAGVALIVLPVPDVWKIPYNLAVIFIGSPLLVSFSVAAQPGPRLAAACRWLGGISYGVYVLHYPLLQLARGLERVALPGSGPVLIPVVVVGVIVGTPVILRVYDAPAHRLLQRLRGPRPATTAASA